MSIPIDQYLHQEVKDYIRDKYGSKKGSSVKCVDACRVERIALT